MNKKIISLILAVIMLLTSSVTLITNASTFTDVAPTHWAASYIDSMRGSNIINGYPDGTFKPENKVKHGEFIKMIVQCRWPFKETPKVPEGEHWATPYAKIANRFIIYEPGYTFEKYETYITRADAVEMIWKLFKIRYPKIVTDKEELYIKSCADEIFITDPETRYYFNSCMQYGLINGFEDGTLRPNETLTRAQAAKLLSIAINK